MINKKINENEEDEFPSDDFFIGKLNENVKDIITLKKIMTEAIIKFKNYMKNHENEDVLVDDLRSTFDLWFQHDNEKNNYFDHLIKDDIHFEEFVISIIENID